MNLPKLPKIPFTLAVLAPCAVVSGVMVGGVFLWQDASGVDTSPPPTTEVTVPLQDTVPPETIFVSGPGPTDEQVVRGFAEYCAANNCVGPRGEPGADSQVPGPKGDKGDPGETVVGSPGVAGGVGARGPAGGQGDPGRDGRDGSPGRPPTAAEIDAAVARAFTTTIPPVPGAPGAPGAASVVPGPPGAPGAASVVPGPPGPAGADSQVPGPPGADSQVPGPQGPVGPVGPPGPPSTELICPAGFEPSNLTLNAPGGQVTMYVCLQQ